MTWVSAEIQERLTFVLAHFVWQGFLIVGLFSATMVLLRIRRPNARYAVHLFAFAGLVASPFATWFFAPGPGPISTRASEAPTEAFAPTFRGAPVEPERTEPNADVPGASAASTAPTPATLLAPPRADLPATNPTPNGNAWMGLQGWTERIRPWQPWILRGWFTGVAILSSRLLLGAVGLWRWRRAALPLPETLAPLVARLCAVMRVTPPAVKLCRRGTDAVAMGLFRPMILLPAAWITELPPDMLKAVLAHELAHVKRYDLWVNLLQRLAETLLFYHPAVWWLSRRLRVERELCCDDLAAQVTDNRLRYAETLEHVARLTRSQSAPNLALAMATGEGSLLFRVRRLLEPLHGHPGDAWTRSTGGGVIVLALVVLLAAMQWTTSQGSSPPATDGKAQDERQSANAAPAVALPPREWPQWGGGSHRNHVAAGPLPIQWDLKTQKNVTWAAKLGTQTYASPVVSGGKVYVGTNNGSALNPAFRKDWDLSCLVCFDLATGSLLWQYASEKLPTGRIHDWPEIGLCSSACADGNRVWVLTNRCEVVCLDANGFRDGENDGPFKNEPAAGELDGDVIWKLDLFNMLGVRPLHQSVCSVTFDDGLLLLNTSNGPDETYLKVPAPNAPNFLALDAGTGRVVWSDNSAGDSIAIGGSSCSCAGSSPAVATLGGVKQAIFAGKEGWVFGFDFDQLKRGQTKVLWKFDANPKSSRHVLGQRSRRNTIMAAPVVAEGSVFVATGGNPETGEGDADLWRIDPTKRGDISSELVFNKAFENGEKPIPHKTFCAFEPEKGDFVRPNPNSGVVWHYAAFDRNSNGKTEYHETFHRSLGCPVVYDGLLFVADYSGLLHCLDSQTGAVLWTHDAQAVTWSSSIVAGGHVLTCDEDGDVTIFKASRIKQKIWESNVEAPIFATPAVVNGTLLLATRNMLFAICEVQAVATNVEHKALLPGGMSIEIVGMTRNTAPAKDGWRADGTPIGDVGHWPSTIVLHNKHTSSAYVENQPHPEPDEEAVDLLIRFQGLKEQPSISFDLAANGISYHHPRFKDPYEFRISTRRREAPAPGTHWSVPDGEVRVHVTDEPWGKWLQIAPDGRVLNPLVEGDLYRSTYDKVQIQAIVPYEQAPDGKALVMRRPQNASSLFGFEIRAVDPAGKPQWVLEWENKSMPGTDQTESRWGLASSEKAPLVRYEYRLRPYRHSVTFQGVSFEPGPASEVKVTTKTVPAEEIERPQNFKGHSTRAPLPNGGSIELVGIAHAAEVTEKGARRKDAKWWTPAGVPLESEPFQLTPLEVVPDHQRFREFAFRLTSRPLPAGERPRLRPLELHGGLWFGMREKRPLRATAWGADGAMHFQLIAGFDSDAKPGGLAFYFSDQPTFEAGFMDLKGKVRPADRIDPQVVTLLETIKLEAIEKVGTETVVKIKSSPHHRGPMQFFLNAIRFDGRNVGAERGVDSERHVFKTPASEVEAFQITVRPMTHRVDCEDIALAPGQKCQPQVRLTPLIELYSIKFRKDGQTLGILSEVRSSELAATLKILQPELNTETGELIVSTQLTSTFESANRLVAQLQAEGWKWPTIKITPPKDPPKPPQANLPATKKELVLEKNPKNRAVQDIVRTIDFSKVVVKGYREALEQTPDLNVRDPKNPNSFQRPRNVFPMPLAEHTWLKYPAGSGHFYIEHRPDGSPESELLYGPIAGDPFERLKLDEVFREKLNSSESHFDFNYRIRLMFRTADAGLMRKAWQFIEPMLQQKFETPRDSSLFKRLEILQIAREALRDESFRRPELAELAERMKKTVRSAEASVDAINDSVPDATYQSAAYRQSKIQAKLPEALWGRTVNGLRLGLVPRNSGPDSNWDNLPADLSFPTEIHVKPGEPLHYLLLIENVSDQPIKFCAYVVGEEMGRSVDVWNQKGEPIQMQSLHTSILHFKSYWRLNPGERMLVTFPAIHFRPAALNPPGMGLGYHFTAPSGRYLLQCKFWLGDLDNERHRHVPGKSEWIGELTTGTQTVIVEDADEGV